MNIFNKIKQMNIDELAEFLRIRFDEEGGSRCAGIGCSNCIDYKTHHYPDDCGNCIWLPVENDYKKWLELDVEIELAEFKED